jgi:hypothetical protein
LNKERERGRLTKHCVLKIYFVTYISSPTEKRGNTVHLSAISNGQISPQTEVTDLYVNIKAWHTQSKWDFWDTRYKVAGYSIAHYSNCSWLGFSFFLSFFLSLWPDKAHYFCSRLMCSCVWSRIILRSSALETSLQSVGSSLYQLSTQYTSLLPRPLVILDIARVLLTWRIVAAGLRHGDVPRGAAAVQDVQPVMWKHEFNKRTLSPGNMFYRVKNSNDGNAHRNSLSFSFKGYSYHPLASSSSSAISPFYIFYFVILINHILYLLLVFILLNFFHLPLFTLSLLHFTFLCIPFYSFFWPNFSFPPPSLLSSLSPYIRYPSVPGPRVTPGRIGLLMVARPCQSPDLTGDVKPSQYRWGLIGT